MTGYVIQLLGWLFVVALFAGIYWLIRRRQNSDRRYGNGEYHTPLPPH